MNVDVWYELWGLDRHLGNTSRDIWLRWKGLSTSNSRLDRLSESKKEPSKTESSQSELSHPRTTPNSLFKSEAKQQNITLPSSWPFQMTTWNQKRPERLEVFCFCWIPRSLKEKFLGSRTSKMSPRKLASVANRDSLLKGVQGSSENPWKTKKMSKLSD